MAELAFTFETMSDVIERLLSAESLELDCFVEDEVEGIKAAREPMAPRDAAGDDDFGDDD